MIGKIKEYKVEGKNISIRIVKLEDSKDIVNGIKKSDKEGIQGMRFENEEFTIENQRKHIKEYLEFDNKYLFVIEKDHKIIGFSSIREILGDTFRTGNFIFSPQDRGQGFGSEAKKLVLEFAFNQLDLIRGLARANKENEISIKALIKQGYKKLCEGIRKNDGSAYIDFELTKDIFNSIIRNY